MSTRARDLIRLLDLSPHPEGGAYREIHRSAIEVAAFEPPQRRRAGTAIYYLLERGQQSRWHRVDADEAWHHYEGGPLELLWTADPAGSVARAVLGPAAADGARPAVVVSAGAWQAARALGDYVLAGCTVAPGFEFSSFRLLADEPGAAAALRRAHPDLAALI
jgi:hypothetical protein